MIGREDRRWFSDRVNIRIKVRPYFYLIIFLIFWLWGCASSLHKASLNLTRAQVLERSFQKELAVAHYRKTLEEASREVRRKPGAQAYVLKGLAEFKLGQLPEASRSFSLAASLGEDRSESWAREVSLYGLALAFEQQGMEYPASRLLTFLAEKGKFTPVVRASLGKLVDFRLKSLSKVSDREKDKILNDSVKLVEKVLNEDPACGFYHYLLSQLFSHQQRYLESFEEAVAARELGLPSVEVFRDNDNQIVFCYQKLKQVLAGDELEQFSKNYKAWIKKWRWPDEETPDWKRR